MAQPLKSVGLAPSTDTVRLRHLGAMLIPTRPQPGTAIQEKISSQFEHGCHAGQQGAGFSRSYVKFIECFMRRSKLNPLIVGARALVGIGNGEADQTSNGQYQASRSAHRVRIMGLSLT